MKKIFKATPALLVLLLSIFVSITLYSCDDDDAPNNPGIIGTWTCSNHYYGGSDSYTFKKTGTTNGLIVELLIGLILKKERIRSMALYLLLQTAKVPRGRM